MCPAGDSQIKELRSLLKKATAEPWEVFNEVGVGRAIGDGDNGRLAVMDDYEQCDVDAALIVALRNAASMLLATYEPQPENTHPHKAMNKKCRLCWEALAGNYGSALDHWRAEAERLKALLQSHGKCWICDGSGYVVRTREHAPAPESVPCPTCSK